MVFTLHKKNIDGRVKRTRPKQMEQHDTLSLVCRYMQVTCRDAELQTARKGRRRYQQQNSVLRRKLREEQAAGEIFRLVALMGCESLEVLTARVADAHALQVA